MHKKILAIVLIVLVALGGFFAGYYLKSQQAAKPNTDFKKISSIIKQSPDTRTAVKNLIAYGRQNPSPQIGLSKAGAIESCEVLIAHISWVMSHYDLFAGILGREQLDAYISRLVSEYGERCLIIPPPPPPPPPGGLDPY